MTNRRTFLGGVLAASGWVGFATMRAATPATVEFYAPSVGRPGARGQIMGNLSAQLGVPERVELQTVQVGHFHGLMHEGDGRVAYLYEAVIPGGVPRRGLVKLADASTIV